MKGFQFKWTVKNLAATILVLLLLGSAIAAYYFYSQLNALKENPQGAAQKEVHDLVAKVGQLIVLPVGEDPTVAVVTDLERLKDQPFFANAQKGYKVLIYTNARKAILYDPVNNRIVEVAPVNIGGQENPVESPGFEPENTKK
ncbi:MAG TPA: hypothetical protein VI954_01850 [Candidatus Paceibacterota bacterium]